MGGGEDVAPGEEAAPAHEAPGRVVLQPHVPGPGVGGADLAPHDVVRPGLHLGLGLGLGLGPGLAAAARRVRVGRLKY